MSSPEQGSFFSPVHQRSTQCGPPLTRPSNHASTWMIGRRPTCGHRGERHNRNDSRVLPLARSHPNIPLLLILQPLHCILHFLPFLQNFQALLLDLHMSTEDGRCKSAAGSTKSHRSLREGTAPPASGASPPTTMFSGGCYQRHYLQRCVPRHNELRLLAWPS
jgi:hypothetical protein